MSGDSEDLRNDGLIVLNRRGAPEGARTIVVTGMARSGTSMVAQVLVTAGVDMGSVRDDIVFEDAEIADALSRHDRTALLALAAERNRRAEIWGFKRPHLFAHAGPDVASAFRNPLFVLTCRDPVAIARRNRISEQVDEAACLRDATQDTRRCMEFALGLTAPALLVSYEKALQQPDGFVDELVAFCGLGVAPERRRLMAAGITAGPDAYLNAARRVFDGYVDRVTHGRLYGWCCQLGLHEPLAIEIVVGDAPPLHVAADKPRPDLAGAGFRFLAHGFDVDISQLVRTGQERLTVRVKDRLFELRGSGRTVMELVGQP